MTYIYQTNCFKVQFTNRIVSGTDITCCQWAASKLLVAAYAAVSGGQTRNDVMAAVLNGVRFQMWHHTFKTATTTSTGGRCIRISVWQLPLAFLPTVLIQSTYVFVH